MRPSQPPVHRRLWILVFSFLAALILWGAAPAPAGAVVVNGGGHNVVAGSSATFGDVVVWADSRFSARQIYYKSLPGGVETRLSPGLTSQNSPAIYGDTIVWSESGNLFYKDISVDLPDGPPHSLTANASLPKASPQVFGDRVVWSQVDGGLSQIYTKRLADIGNGSPVNPDNGYNQSAPAVYGDYVVWVSSTVGGSSFDLRFKNLATGISGDLCKALNDQSRPAIYGSVVVWEDQRDGVPGPAESVLPQVYFYNLAAGPPADPQTAGTRLSATAGRQSKPALVGETVYWLDARGGETGINDIYKAVIGGAETLITSGSANRDNPSIHTNFIYEEQPAGLYGANWDILSGAAPITGALDSITVTPTGVSLAAGQTQTFLAQGHDASGNPVTASYDWTATGGTPAPQSGNQTTYTAGGTFGDFSVTASSGGKAGIASVNISPTPLAYIMITGAAELAAGATTTYSAQGYDAADDPIAGLTYSWSANGGTIPPAGASVSYTASTSNGPYQIMVSATSGGTKTASQGVTVVPGPLHHLDITPTSATMPRGASLDFSVQGQDQYHNVIAGLTYFWSATNGTVNPPTGASTSYTAPGSGSSDTVTVTAGGKTASAPVTLVYLDHITVTPSSIALSAGAAQVFDATGYDQFGTPINGLSFAWTATGGTVNPGSGASTTYTAGTTPGTGFYVRAAIGAVSADASLSVNPGPLDRIVITPDSVALAPAESQLFTAQGFDIWNNQIPDVAFTWTATGGTVSPGSGTSTLYSAGAAAGPFTVTAISGSKSGSAAVTVNPTNSVPVYRFYNFLQGVHFYTRSETERAYLQGPSGNWTFRLEGVAFSAYPDKVTNSVAVYRFYNFRQGVHFYTANAAEAENVKRTAAWTFRYEGESYYAMPPASPAPAGFRRVYRFYNFKQGVHFYTANPAEAANVSTNLSYMYRDEGVAYCVPN